MSTYVPAKKNTEFIFYISLRSQADSAIFQANPTIAAGDFKVSTDGGATANPSTLPAVTPASSKTVKVTLSASEMNGDNITLVASDASGAEWMDGMWLIQTSARQVDDLCYPATSGRSIDVDASGGVEVGSFQAGAITAAAIATGAIDADAIAADAVAEIADGVWDEAQSGHVTAGTFGRFLDAQVANVETDTQDIQGRLPAALVSGRIDASVGAMATDVLTSTALAASAVTEIQSGLSTLDAAGVRSAVGLAAANLDTQLSTIDDFLDTEVAAIKAKTDSLTFTVAGQVDANIQAVNDITVNGAGTAGSPWGP